MLQFRGGVWPQEKTPSADQLRQLIADAVDRRHFFLAASVDLIAEHQPHEEVYWEPFRGNLLDYPQTRCRERFESWNLYLLEKGERSAEPLLSVKLSMDRRQLHVTRAIRCYVWEAYSEAGNVIQSRETQKWVRELVGTIDLTGTATGAAVLDELICLLFLAVVGVSRLPLTSIEAPLPGFSFGQIAYVYRASADGPVRSVDALLTRALADDLAEIERVKLLEASIRAAPIEEIAILAARWSARSDLIYLLRRLFDDVALSPYTDFVDKALPFIASALAIEQQVDVLSYLLRQQSRHLTAYDLETFHHRGANYPDALLIDAVLKAYLQIVDARQELFADSAADDTNLQKSKRLRRRALRQGYLLRRRYEGLPVPNLPTSPGENVRVLPAGFARVPDEQILESAKRTRLLYPDDPTDALFKHRAAAMLSLAISDLQHPLELRELGTALFLDRPLGVGKARGERDQTLLLSHVAYSRSLAERSLRQLQSSSAALPETVEGIPLAGRIPGARIGVVSLADALLRAPDFVVLATTRRAVRDFFNLFDLRAVSGLIPEQRLVILDEVTATGEPRIVVYDALGKRRLELEVDLSQGYASRCGQEYPAAGLRVVGGPHALGLLPFSPCSRDPI